jgi:hypothetical protein
VRHGRIVVSLVNKAEAPYGPSAKKKTLHPQLDPASQPYVVPTKNSVHVETVELETSLEVGC